MSALRAHTSELTEGMSSTGSLEGAAGGEGPGAPPQTRGEPLARAGVGAAEPPAATLPEVELDSVVPHSVSGVAERGAVADMPVPSRSAARAKSGEQSRPSNTRAQSFHRYLSAQSDIDEEVLRLYKLVCRV